MSQPTIVKLKVSQKIGKFTVMSQPDLDKTRRSADISGGQSPRPEAEIEGMV